jgi:hypothetical protein
MKYYCDTCECDYSCKSSLKTHYESKKHNKRLENLKNIQCMNTRNLKFTLDVKNKKNEIIGKVKVDKEVYYHVLNNNYCICLSGNSYPVIFVEGKLYRFHRYIYYNFYKKNRNRRHCS